MNKISPNLDLLPSRIAEFEENKPDEYFDTLSNYLADNISQIDHIFETYVSVFINEPTILNFLKLVYFLIYRIGSPAFFSLEGSKILEIPLDQSINPQIGLELKRITKYCTTKFTMMQTAHEIPNIYRRYTELCEQIKEDPEIVISGLTEFEQLYSKYSQTFRALENELESVGTDAQKAEFQQAKTSILNLLEKLDALVIQPDPRFTKSENELILNFFHQKYNVINRIQNDYFDVFQEYENKKGEKKLQEKSLKDQSINTVQNISQFTYFVEGTSLAAFPESMTIEYKDYIYPFRNEELKKKLKATICAFLNTNGGRIFIGVNNVGFLVKGLFLTTNDQDNLVRDIDALLKDFHPKVEPNEVQTVFIPIKKKDSDEFRPGFYVVKIIVKRGKPNELYFTGKDCYKRRNGKNEIQVPANFKKDILERFSFSPQTHPELFAESPEFNDPLPETGTPVLDVKDKARTQTKVNQKALQGLKQKLAGQGVFQANFKKIVVKNYPIHISDANAKLQAILSVLAPTATFKVKQKKCCISFVSPQEAQSFLEKTNSNPVAIDSVILQFVPKPAEEGKVEKQEKKEKTQNQDKAEKKEKKKPRVEIEDDKKDNTDKQKENSTVIWIRGIPENMPDLKDRIISLLGKFSELLKEIKVHNKKKRASIEFDSANLTNQVLDYLLSEERYVDTFKLSFQKATPPTSPNQGTKPKNIKHPHKNSTDEEFEQKVEGATLKVSGIPLDPLGNDLEYLLRACDHHTRKLQGYSISEKKDFILLQFKSKEEATNAFEFFTENNFTYKDKKINVEFVGSTKKSTQLPKKEEAKEENKKKSKKDDKNKQKGQAQGTIGQSKGHGESNGVAGKNARNSSPSQANQNDTQKIPMNPEKSIDLQQFQMNQFIPVEYQQGYPNQANQYQGIINPYQNPYGNINPYEIQRQYPNGLQTYQSDINLKAGQNIKQELQFGYQNQQPNFPENQGFQHGFTQTQQLINQNVQNIQGQQMSNNLVTQNQGGQVLQRDSSPRDRQQNLQQNGNTQQQFLQQVNSHSHLPTYSNQNMPNGTQFCGYQNFNYYPQYQELNQQQSTQQGAPQNLKTSTRIQDQNQLQSPSQPVYGSNTGYGQNQFYQNGFGQPNYYCYQQISQNHLPNLSQGYPYNQGMLPGQQFMGQQIFGGQPYQPIVGQPTAPWLYSK